VLSQNASVHFVIKFLPNLSVLRSRHYATIHFRLRHNRAINFILLRHRNGGTCFRQCRGRALLAASSSATGAFGAWDITAHQNDVYCMWIISASPGSKIRLVVQAALDCSVRLGLSRVFPPLLLLLWVLWRAPRIVHCVSITSPSKSLVRTDEANAVVMQVRWKLLR